mmetsp:Transcript_2563/g.7065  ORF Transcript_2563/g.7065 Transcript_2563/m.7065 type:complete len:128 (+) Transcript_2563:763-1146(+)
MLLWSDPSEAPLLQGSRVGSSGSAPREDPDAMGFDQAHVAYDALAADNGANGNVLPSAVDRSMLQSRGSSREQRIHQPAMPKVDEEQVTAASSQPPHLPRRGSQQNLPSGDTCCFCILADRRTAGAL